VSQATRIKDLPDLERPRERLAAQGAEALSPAELIAIMLRTGLRGRSAIEVAHDLIRQHGDLNALARASLGDLQKIKGIGRDKAVTLQAAFTLARRMARELRHPRPRLDQPGAVAEHLREEFRGKEVEEFHVVLLDTRRRLIRIEGISTGTLDSAIVHAREVFRGAIGANASAIILVHNHPSGDPTPSKADITVTRDLIRAGQLLKIEVLDHVIVGERTADRERDYFSLKEHGYFYQ
jgi:DNA repair protein RadC